MLWSLVKILVFVAVIALLTYGAGFLMESSGGIQITVAGTEYTLAPLQSVIAGLVLLVVVWVVLKLLSLLVATLKFLNGDETAISRYFDKGRERRGYQALADGLMALASGEGRLAMSKAAKAEKYLGKPELTNLLTAQAAELAGDSKKASEAYKQLIGTEATRFVGVRGIMKQKLAEGDDETARKLAEKAHALKPRHEEVQDVLLRLQAQAEDWAGARNTLSSKLKSGSLPRDVYRRRDAVLALSEAREIVDEGSSIEAREKAIEANRQSPDLVPAAAMAARAYVEAGKPRNAVKILKKAWEAQPHPDLAAAFAAIEPEETPAQRVKRFAVLTKIHPEHMETRLVLAELQIVAGDFPEARRALGNVSDGTADARALTLMAAIERGEGASDSVVQGWLAKALSAPRGPQWVCDNCQSIQAQWAPVCARCNSFDTLSWKTPVTPEIASATGVHMLPLIIGLGDGDSADDDSGEEITEVALIEPDDPEVIFDDRDDGSAVKQDT
ncbi:MAG: heme biosynthesis protein HemY [Rhodobacteraceae bacterium]|nr:MAG: heme biosynthesis protein HemY [Paracoccaceae bacterium]